MALSSYKTRHLVLLYLAIAGTLTPSVSAQSLLVPGTLATRKTRAPQIIDPLSVPNSVNCKMWPYTSYTRVSSLQQLHKALTDAKPGSMIEVEPGFYNAAGLKVGQEPILPTGVNPNANDNGGADVFSLKGEPVDSYSPSPDGPMGPAVLDPLVDKTDPPTSGSEDTSISPKLTTTDVSADPGSSSSPLPDPKATTTDPPPATSTSPSPPDSPSTDPTATAGGGSTGQNDVKIPSPSPSPIDLNSDGEQGDATRAPVPSPPPKPQRSPPKKGTGSSNSPPPKKGTGTSPPKKKPEVKSPPRRRRRSPSPVPAPTGAKSPSPSVHPPKHAPKPGNKTEGAHPPKSSKPGRVTVPSPVLPSPPPPSPSPSPPPPTPSPPPPSPKQDAITVPNEVIPKPTVTPQPRPQAVAPIATVLNLHGTPEAYITICGPKTAVFDGTQGQNMWFGHAFRVVDSSYIRVSGFTFQNALKGLDVQRTNASEFTHIFTQNTRQEGIRVRYNSTYNKVQYCNITNTGRMWEGFGEGIYVGTSKRNSVLQGLPPDFSDYNEFRYNRFGPGILAENIDVKEFTTGGKIVGNYFNGTDIQGINGGFSWVSLKGNNWTVFNNTGDGLDLAGAGFRVLYQWEGEGMYNRLLGNACYNFTSDSSYCVYVSPEARDTVVGCSNGVQIPPYALALNRGTVIVPNGEDCNCIPSCGARTVSKIMSNNGTVVGPSVGTISNTVDLFEDLGAQPATVVSVVPELEQDGEDARPNWD